MGQINCVYGGALWAASQICRYLSYKTQNFKGFVCVTLLTSVTANKRLLVQLGL